MPTATMAVCLTLDTLSFVQSARYGTAPLLLSDRGVE